MKSGAILLNKGKPHFGGVFLFACAPQLPTSVEFTLLATAVATSSEQTINNQMVRFASLYAPYKLFGITINWSGQRVEKLFLFLNELC